MIISRKFDTFHAMIFLWEFLRSELIMKQLFGILARILNSMFGIISILIYSDFSIHYGSCKKAVELLAMVDCLFSLAKVAKMPGYTWLVLCVIMCLKLMAMGTYTISLHIHEQISPHYLCIYNMFVLPDFLGSVVSCCLCGLFDN